MGAKADITIHSAVAGARGMHQECCDRGDILMFLTRQRNKSYITKGFVLESQGRVSPTHSHGQECTKSVVICERFFECSLMEE